MSNGGININVSGGAFQLGNAVQGDQNVVTTQSQNLSVEVAKAFADAGAALDARAALRPDEQSQIDQLKADLAELKAAVETKRKSRWGTVLEAAKAIHGAYAWAAPLLKPLFAVIAPGLVL